VPVRHVLVVLACDDVARSKAFYEAVFGWRVIVDLAVYVELEVPTGLRVGLYARTGFASNTGEAPAGRPPTGTTACELYLRVDDPEAALERLAAAGARLLSRVAPRVWGDEAGYAADLDGNVVAVSRPLDEA
jgi:catechol 2,3-dioxygenase-like lactoylglutathione lyase family enzyme